MKTFIVIAFGLALLLALAQSSPLQNIVDEDFQMELQNEKGGNLLEGSTSTLTTCLTFYSSTKCKK
jgi:hypothetical protein